MNQRNGLIVLTVAALMALLFCLTGTALAGPGPNPGGQDDTKIIGPSPKTFLLVGWKFSFTSDDVDYGTLEGYVWVDGKVFMGIPEPAHRESLMKEATAFDLTTWQYPPAIAQHFGFPEGTSVIVQKEGDVSNFEVITDIDPDDPDQIWNPFVATSFSYRHILVCNVKFSFEVSR